MLKLYYTTTKGQDVTQPNAYNSLGGYKSVDLFKNDEFESAFGEISLYTVSKNNQNQYIALMLKNEGITTIENINIWFEFPADCYSKLSIAAVDPVADDEGYMYIENVKTLHSSPVYADFYEANEEENKVDLGDLAAGQMLGLWIKREILVDVIKTDLSEIVENDPEKEHRVRQKTLSTSDLIEMKISYD